ncbi:MAG: aconitate hydratase, partial [Firmicutes bacterium]|nr:aconitate hydratase [Bacillota bacterium]
IFLSAAASVQETSSLWEQLDAPVGLRFLWQKDSSYIRRPPFISLPQTLPNTLPTARILALLGDSVTTDHISPAGNIAASSPAGLYLQAQGIAPRDFNSYGSRRGNHEVMMRGTFANVRLRNYMVPGSEGGVTRLVPENTILPIYDAAQVYQKRGEPVVIFAGKEYGTGSSRDWAAKGSALLGVQAVIAQSFERIHRSNLIGMGIVPLEFLPGESWQTWQLTGEERIHLAWTPQSAPHTDVLVTVHHLDHTVSTHYVRSRVDTLEEAEFMQAGGLIPWVMAQRFAPSGPTL